MAKCDCCGINDDRLFTKQYDNKSIDICFGCHCNWLIFGSSDGGICHECKKVKYGMPKRPELNDKLICKSCYDKILNSDLNNLEDIL